MAEIILIYDIADVEIATQLAAEIEKAGVTVAKLAQDGAVLNRYDIVEVVSARGVVVVWSPASVESEFVRGCAKLAADRGKLVGLRTHDLAANSIPIEFSQLQTLLVDDWEGIGEAISALFVTPSHAPPVAPPMPVVAAPIAPAATPVAPAPVAPAAAPVAPTSAPVAAAAVSLGSATPSVTHAATPPAVVPGATAFGPPERRFMRAATGSGAPSPVAPPTPAPPPTPSLHRPEGIGAASDGVTRFDKMWQFESELRKGASVTFGTPTARAPRPVTLTIDALQQARGTSVIETEPPAAPSAGPNEPSERSQFESFEVRVPSYSPRPAAAAPRSSWWPIVAIGVVSAGFVYLFRETLAQNADRLLAILGLAKGAMPPLPAFTLDPEVVVDDVDCSVFSPPAAPRGARIMVQVFLHRMEQAERAQFLAETMDDTAKLRGVQTLRVPILRRTSVQIELDGRGLKVTAPMQNLFWNGHPTVASFEVEVPPGFEADVCHPVARVMVDGEPVGRILFQLRIEAATRDVIAQPAPELGGTSARRYEYAFLSYASKDRAEVLKRAQAFQVAKLEFFHDVLSLEPGQRYTEEILLRIGKSDLFVLFWSRSAKRSEWVQKEIDCALACQRNHPSGLPDIVPIMLEPISKAPPPPDLAHLHLNAPINTLIAASQPSLLQRIKERLFG